MTSRGDFTRQAVLDIMKNSSKRLSEYQVLHELQKVTDKPATQIAYRTLS